MKEGARSFEHLLLLKHSFNKLEGSADTAGRSALVARNAHAVQLGSYVIVVVLQELEPSGHMGKAVSFIGIDSTLVALATEFAVRISDGI